MSRLAALSSRVARARTATVRVWVPALPPMEAAMGLITASAASLAIDPWKMPITQEARMAVPRLINSHQNRDRVIPMMVSPRPRSDTPARASMSSSLSSWMTPTMSSTVI